MEKLEETIFKLKSSLQNIETMETSIKNDEGIKLSTINNLKILDETKNILTILKNHKMESKKEFILKTINTALIDVFDQNLRIDIEATSSSSTGKIHMKYDIVLYQNDIEMARNEKLLGNNGGGVLSFISILFKILVGYIYSDNKFYLFDESISQVSPLYRPRLAQFLRKFCEQYNFTIVLISQTDDIDEFANVGYYLDGEFNADGVPVLKIDHILGEYPTENYVYSKIRNFQSIVELEFRYKGFTVIRGNNNIGKSASFRAVNAVLFNTFDSKDHPRKKRARGAETKIEFGFYGSEEDLSKKIILTFKSNKVQYSFDDLTFSGKQLAFDKIKEKVESIGFKYVSLKDTYKNFKGNLKDQTERLAMTTQHDGFYLVGNKTNETEKVFNFLFDSTDVANAIAQCNIDYNDSTNILNTALKNITENTFKLKQERLIYEILSFKYYTTLIELHNNAYIAQESMKHRLELIKINSAYTESILSIMNGLSIIENNNMKLHSLKNSNINLKVSVIDELIYSTKHHLLLQKYFETNTTNNYSKNKQLNLNNQLTIINDLQSYIESINSLNMYITHSNKYNDSIMKQSKLIKNISNIDKIVQITEYLESVKYYINTFELYFKNKNKNLISNHSERMEKVDEIINIIKTKEEFDNKLSLYDSNLTKILELEETSMYWKNELSNNDKIFGITECTCCDATGYIIKE